MPPFVSQALPSRGCDEVSECERCSRVYCVDCDTDEDTHACCRSRKQSESLRKEEKE